MNNRIKALQEQAGAKTKEIRALLDTAAKENRAITSDENTKLVAIEKEVEQFNVTLEAEIRSFATESNQARHLSRGEQRDVEKFDYSKLLRHLHRAAKGTPSRLEGIEAEMIAEGEKEARSAEVEPHGIMLPSLLVRRGGYERRDMTATGTTSTTLDQGGMTIATQKAALLDDFFNASVLRAGGALVINDMQGNLDVPRIVAGTAPTGKAENSNADEVSPTTLQLSLRPNRLPAYIDIGEQLIKQSSSAIEAILRGHLTAQMVAVQEKAFFHGTGTNEAEGIAATSGIGSVAGGTNGLAPTWGHMVDLEEAVDATNALMGSLHYMSNGKVRAKLKKTQKASGTDSKMILEGNDLNGYSPLWTNAISRTLVKGSSGAACSAIFFGNCADYWIGYWGGIALEMIRDKPNAIAGLYTLVASAYYDGGVVRPKSFAAMLDALAA